MAAIGADYLYASVRGLLTLKRQSMAYIQTANRTIERSPHAAAIGEINRLVKRSFDVAGRERARRVVETAVGTRTY